MIIFLYGPDTYRLQQKLAQIKKKAKELVFIDSFEEFKQATETKSLFNTRKVIIINKLCPEFNNIQDSEDIIIFCDEKPDKRTKLFKKLLKTAQSEEFNFLENRELITWVQEQANIDFNTANKLAAYAGNDLWQLCHEIAKLKAYANNKPISDKHIDLLVKAKISTDIFKTIDALGRGDKKTALKLVYEHLAAGDDEQYLFNMFCYQFRNILKIKLNNYSDMHPFVLRKTKLIAQKYSLEKLQTIYSELLTLDLWSKTSKVERPATFFLLLSQA